MDVERLCNYMKAKRDKRLNNKNQIGTMNQISFQARGSETHDGSKIFALLLCSTFELHEFRQCQETLYRI